MKKLTLLLATITLATLVLAVPAVPLRADGCGGSGGGGVTLSIANSPIFDNSLGGDCTTAPEPNSFVLLAVGIGALGLILFLRELKASKAVGGQAGRS